MKCSFLSLTAVAVFVVDCLAATDYHERLVLQPLPGSSLLASFNFRSNSSASAFEKQHFRYFPRSLGQILQHAHTKELHLRFTTGRWDDESWGTRPWEGYKEGATGVELWAWIDSASQEDAYANWSSLTQSLSGLFCASMNFIGSTRTTSPVVSFEPLGDHSGPDQLHLLHGTLPGEVVCTENLTPFLKMLPCKGKAGVSSLFDGHKLFDASWQSMSIDVRPICSSEGECLIEIEQSVDMVLDIDRSKRPRDNPIPRPVPFEQLACDPTKPYNSHDTCFPLERKSEAGWTLSEIFGRPIRGHCPLTDDNGVSTQTVCLKVPSDRSVFTTPGATEISDPSGVSRCYILSASNDFDLILPEEEAKTQVPLQQGVLHAERTIIGHGQERGGMRVIFRNPSTVESVDFIYFESLPWFMRPYLHTLQATVVGNDGISRQLPVSEIIDGIYYRPAVDRERGTQLELVLSVPADSTVTLIYDIEKAILRYTEYPPDANRGFNVAPAVIRILDQENHSSSVYLRTTGLLLSLPTPDFSMPYNVIILTSTVMALGFGSIFNLLVRRFIPADEPALRAYGLKARLASRLVTLRDRIRGKASKPKE
ncbi:hypothetical protein UA08_08971 [Talaromyces atroroseus]|uniref:GPI transamidase component GPI16 n=1 Tax=Talaromyces atroroseus TaxID=1441469 RepID=A0A1Q5Q7B8_TALAT|nr:hypothetical protein UA08_08971 [Talaromyces atroroseus]OKL55744.1 hypothetical protein UA08_08971 [Talaromyces atroroseus]